MYNTNFQVKYKSIEDELISKIQNKNINDETINNNDENENDDEDSFENEDYSNQDILDICDKLYKDELASAFFAEDIFDPKLEKGIEELLIIMQLNPDFKQLLHDIKPDTFEQISNDNIFKKNTEFLVFAMLFSQDFFYITHKCICQQLVSGTISNDLIDELKKKSIEIIYNL
jgi:hypothetical protein